MENRPAQRHLVVPILLLWMLLFGCSASRPQRNSPATIEAGIALTPPEHYTPYYSTQKARALGESYSENLDRLLERVTQSPIGKMQFANAIVSMSLGFFTHSASRPPDERYLETILAMPDILEEEEDVNATVSRLFAQYGRDILAILASDTTIADDPKVAGYGINFSWRNMLKTPSGPRMSMREAVIYVPKKKSERFLNRQIEHDELLGTSTIFVRQGEKAAQQVRYSPPASQPWLQAPPASPESQGKDFLPESTSRSEIQESHPSISPEQGPLRTPPKVPLPSPSLQKPAAAAGHPNPTTSPTRLSPSQKQQKQKLSRGKHPPTPIRRPSSPSPRQRTSPERQLFDPPHARNTAAMKTTLSPQRATSLQSSRKGSYLVQFPFAELLEAQRWADALKKRGYVTSLKFVKKENQPIHLRVGRFASIAEATQFVDDFKAQGLHGLVLKGPR